MSFTSLVVHLFSLSLAPACLPSFLSNWHMTITSCLLALFLRLSFKKYMKGLEFLQVKERTAACAESTEAAGQLSPLSLAFSVRSSVKGGGPSEFFYQSVVVKLHSAHSLKRDPQAPRCGFWGLGEEGSGRGLDLPNHTTLGSGQSHSSQQHQGSQHPEH
ncbi:hypothetical protein F2Q68_00009851 [Brassica cretica]|uniref:Uncharacterized protein n=1 Tax=Brassica cretica TaxID=69181 RepID=A0A8S9L4R7_BRACR|nr:hypothetical protein F2Q68_00009851 [Brassica cretica]